MVVTWSHLFNYSHPWEVVTSAIWQKYPNPFASHVIAADVIDRSIDPITGVMTTTRLFLKEGRLPKWAARFFKVTDAFILEVSTVDPVSRTFTTVTRNLSHAKLVLVEETQIVSPKPGNPSGATEVRTKADIISNTGFKPFRERLEDWGLKRLQKNTMRSSEGLMHVIKKLSMKVGQGPSHGLS